MKTFSKSIVVLILVGLLCQSKKTYSQSGASVSYERSHMITIYNNTHAHQNYGIRGKYYDKLVRDFRWGEWTHVHHNRADGRSIFHHLIGEQYGGYQIGVGKNDDGTYEEAYDIECNITDFNPELFDYKYGRDYSLEFSGGELVLLYLPHQDKKHLRHWSKIENF